MYGRMKQPISAKVAVSEGGIIGKGPGGSTQRYVVPIMFEDYMFSFIVEEYGIIGALIVILLYGSLLARGTILVRNSTNCFTKTAIAGLVVMIRRGDKSLIPSGDTILQAGDRLVILNLSGEKKI